MMLALTPQQDEARAGFRALVDEHILPHANRFDEEEEIPRDLVRLLGRERRLIATLPLEAGGEDMDPLTSGLLSEEMGRGCASVRNLMGVSGMVAHAILRWGSKAQKEQWLPRLGAGETIGAFALTEPQGGSDAANLRTTATPSGGAWTLNGSKKWISFAQTADVFLSIAQCENKPAAFLVERDTPGLMVKPITGLLGLRASKLAEVQFENCSVPAENMVLSVGAGFALVASFALDYGRHSTACGCVGLAQRCLDACRAYARERRAFGAPIKDHQLIQQMLTNMVTNISAGRLLCHQAGYLRGQNDPGAVRETLIAKYFTTAILPQITGDAVQIHGASGCSADSPVQRCFRDAKIMEIVEGTTQIHQIKIAAFA